MPFVVQRSLGRNALSGILMFIFCLNGLPFLRPSDQFGVLNFVTVSVNVNSLRHAESVTIMHRKHPVAFMGFDTVAVTINKTVAEGRTKAQSAVFTLNFYTNSIESYWEILVIGDS